MCLFASSARSSSPSACRARPLTQVRSLANWRRRPALKKKKKKDLGPSQPGPSVVTVDPQSTKWSESHGSDPAGTFSNQRGRSRKNNKKKIHTTTGEEPFRLKSKSGPARHSCVAQQSSGLLISMAIRVVVHI